MEHPVSAVLLAAGSSSRMGRTKQLLPLGDRPVIRRCIDTLTGAAVGRIVVVIGDCVNGLAGHLNGLPVTIAVNNDHGSDMAASVRRGLGCLDPSGAVLICLSDHPLVSVETIKMLIHEHHDHPRAIVIPEYHGRRGHPTLFPRTIIDEIFSGSTLRDIVRKDTARVRLLTVQDEGVILDMDTPEDYSILLNRIGAPLPDLLPGSDPL